MNAGFHVAMGLGSLLDGIHFVHQWDYLARRQQRQHDIGESLYDCRLLDQRTCRLGSAVVGSAGDQR